MVASHFSSTSKEMEVSAGNASLRERDERLEALKAVVGHLAHDFNNYLVPLLGYVTLIREDVDAMSTAGQFTAKLETSARKTEGAIESILLAARPQRRFNPKTGSFTELLSATINAWRAEVPAMAQIQIHSLLQPFEFHFDENHWAVAIRHLLNNARYAMATGGTLDVSLEPCSLTQEEAADLGISAQEAFRLVFKDTGFGMSPTVLRRACEPFFTTRPKGQAAGLGLTTVHSVVRLHGGQLLLESAEDRGTTVTIWMPRNTSAVSVPVPVQAAPPVQRSTTPAPSAAGRKVLVVDDDPLVREVVKAYLQKTQVEALMAQNGVEALRIFRKHGPDLALVVSDITMPEMNGIEFYRKVRELSPDVRFFFISGDAEAASEDALSKFGSERPFLLRKPFTLKSFTETVKSQMS